MNDGRRIVLTGDLKDENQLSWLRDTLEEQWTSGAEDLTVDMEGVTNINFDALAEILGARNRFVQAGAHLNVVNVPPVIRKLMELFRIPVS